MDQDVRREMRLLALVALMIGIYGSVVGVIAASAGKLHLLFAKGIGEILAGLWIGALLFVFLAYAGDLFLRRRPSRPFQVMLAELREGVLRADWLIARVAVVVGWFCLMNFFTPIKMLLGQVRGFPLDPLIMHADRLLFFGHDPWRITHALFGGTWVTYLIATIYSFWFGLMWVSIIYMVLRPEMVELRARYLTAFILCWTLVGTAGAYLLGSAGPCFYERVLGDPHYAPLMERLAQIHANLQSVSPKLGLWMLGLQDYLWSGYVSDSAIFAGGISAMPSMHVALSVVIACAGWKLNRRVGWATTVFALFIWIGSIHLGWHYALDGIVGAAMALGIWRLSGWLVERFVLVEPRRREVLA